MKRKLLFGLLAILFAFTLTACGNDDVIDNNNSNDNDGGEIVEEKGAFDELDLYSDDTKVVFESGLTRLVFYHDGTVITAYHAYIDYTDNESAEYALSALNKELSIKKAYTKGRFLVIEYADEEFEGYTLEDVELAYAIYKKITK